MSPKKLWPTPTGGDSKNARNATAKRHKIPPTGIHAGETLTDAISLAPDQTDQQPTSQLTLLPEDSLASLLVLPGSDEARKMTVGSGLKCLESLRRSDRSGLLRRTLLGSSTWGSTIVYLTWRIAATVSNRILFQLVPSTPRTDGIESSLWLTPAATNINGRSDEAVERRQAFRESIGRKSVNVGSLAEQVHYGRPVTDLRAPKVMWSTPKQEPSGPDYARADRPESGGDDLATVVAKQMWPTPTGRDHKDTGDLENVEDNGLLGRVVRPSKKSGSLSPQWVEWLQGFPNGWTDLEPSETP